VRRTQSGTDEAIPCHPVIYFWFLRDLVLHMEIPKLKKLCPLLAVTDTAVELDAAMTQLQELLLEPSRNESDPLYIAHFTVRVMSELLQ